MGKGKEHRTKLKNIKNCQHDAWISAVSRGYEGGCSEYSDTNPNRLCIHHFHPSAIEYDKNGKCRLKTGAAPTLNMTKFSMENENFKEEKYFNDCWSRGRFTMRV